MPGRPALVLAIVAALPLAALTAVAARQNPAAPQQTPPVFRAGVDVIQLDVSVLDKNRKPVRGLTDADFTVLENGAVQRLVGVAEIVAPDPDESKAAWLRL